MNSNHIKVILAILFDQTCSTNACQCFPIMKDKIPFVYFLNSCLRKWQCFFIFPIPSNEHSIVLTYVIFRKITTHVSVQTVNFLFKLQQSNIILMAIRLAENEKFWKIHDVFDFILFYFSFSIEHEPTFFTRYFLLFVNECMTTSDNKVWTN